MCPSVTHDGFGLVTYFSIFHTSQSGLTFTGFPRGFCARSLVRKLLVDFLLLLLLSFLWLLWVMLGRTRTCVRTPPEVSTNIEECWMG